MHNIRFRESTPATALELKDVSVGASRSRGKTSGACWLLGTAMLATMAAQPLQAQVPAVVANSTSTLASGFSAGPAVTDACGNVYVYEGGGTGVVQISAATGAVTTVAKNPQGYQSLGPALYMDVAKKYLYFPDFGNFYTTNFDQLAIVNCAPGTLSTTFANNLGNLGNYYWGTAREVAGDAAGDVFFVTTANVTQAIYKEAYNATTNTYTDTQPFTWKNNINWLASDAAGDLFFVDNATQDVYELPVNNGSYPTTPIILIGASHFGTIAGLSFDPEGNLYITDSKTNLVYEVPNENGALNPADLFLTASVGAPFKAAVDAFHNLYLSNYSPGATKVAVGYGTASATAVGATTGTFSITYLFNSAVTPTAISALNGTAAAGSFTVTGGTCTVGKIQAALSTCTVTGSFAPTAAGRAAGVVSFGSAAGTLLTYVGGTGQGPAVTIDPGTVTPFVGTLTAPSGVAVDAANNIYVTDTSANTVTMYTSATSTGTTLSTGSIKLSGPKGLAIDGAGDIFIADTGNSRIVEIPVIGGTLAPASTAVLAVTVKNPQGVAVDSAGNLAIADTGNNRLVLVPNVNGALSFGSAQTIATGLGGPNAVAFDSSSNLFVTEATNNDVLEFTAPVGSGAGVKVAAGFTTPTSVAADSSGSVFVVDSGSGNVVRYPSLNGTLGAKTLVGGSILNPIGVALDNKGNLYVTDTTNDVVNQINRVRATLQFGGVNVGSTGTQTGAINSSGNQPVVFSKPDYTVAPNPALGFAVTADTCSGATLAAGSSCAITATYTPPARQLNAEEDLTFQANGGNGSPILQLIGTGAQTVPSTLSLTLTSPAGATSLSAGQAAIFTAQVGTGTSTLVPGGSVKFFVNGTQVGSGVVKSNNGVYTAVLTLAGGLPAGNPVVVSAVYSGDIINYSSSSAQLNIVVNPLADGVTLNIVTPYNTPNSVVDDSVTISGVSMTRAGGVVTATIPSNTTFLKGAAVSVTAAGDSSFLGVFTLTSVSTTPTSSTLTWIQGGSPNNVTAAVTGTITAREDLAAGPAVPLTATVKPSGTISPTGTVSFYAGSTLLGIASVAPGTFQAAITTTALRAGTTATVGSGSYISNYNLTAVYSGDSIYAGGTSNTVPLSVVAPPFSAPACALTGANGASPTCLLNTTGAAFTITPTNPAITVAAGQTSGSTTLTITSYGGWSGVLNFTCAGLPAYASCQALPGAPVVNASTATAAYPQTTVTFTINTDVPPQEVHTSTVVWWLGAGAGLCLLLARRRLVRAGHFGSGRLMMVSGLLLLLGGWVVGIGGCSSGGTPYITPSGSSNVVVTVRAAQSVPGTTTQQVQLQDGNVPPLTIALSVK